MSIKKTYFCDLCNESIDKDGHDGVYWIGDGRMEQQSSDRSEHHICKPCRDGLKKFDVVKVKASTP